MPANAQTPLRRAPARSEGQTVPSGGVWWLLGGLVGGGGGFPLKDISPAGETLTATKDLSCVTALSGE